MSHFVENSLILVTALSPHIGYDNATQIADKAYEKNTTLKEAAIKSGLVSAEEFDEYIDPWKMV